MKVTKIFECSVEEACELPFYDAKVQAGLPSPVDGYMCNRMDLNKRLIKHPNSTFFVQVTGESMIDAGIKENDLLVVDKAIEPTNNKIVIAVINNEFTVKRFKIINDEAFLVPENKEFQSMKMVEGCYIWGVVIFVIQLFAYDKNTHKYAIMHMEIIKKFGRFPHRNIILGRESTEEEIRFLDTPNSSF